MIDLIRTSAVPANLMRSAARGALSLPAAEMLEILVLLATHPLYGEAAQLTLAGWDEAAALGVVADPEAPPAVLDYLSSPANLRPKLLPELLENRALPRARLLELANSLSPTCLPVLAGSDRVCSCPEVVQALLARPDLADVDRERLQLALSPSAAEIPDAEDSGTEAPPGEASQQDLLEPALSEYLRTHAEEISSETGKPFHLIDATPEERAEIASVESEPVSKGVSLAAAAAKAMSLAASENRDRTTPVQKIARMTVGERVQLAYRGSHDERFILIRDGARVVSTAVMESPKLTEAEVETFASLKSISEYVLRIIGTKRKYTEVSLPLIKELLIMDLKNLMGNKNVTDTVRHFALKVYKDKTTSRR
jgi:protein-disulfide isomerase-like protein with CxxC motif